MNERSPELHDRLHHTGDLARRLAALAHPARIEILRHLAKSECCCCKDVVGCLDLAQSTVSQHLRILVDAGLLTMAQERQRSLYRIEPSALSDLGRAMAELMENCCAGAPCDAPDANNKT